MTSPYAIGLDDLESTVRVPAEEQVEEEPETRVGSPSEAELERAAVHRMIAFGLG